AQLVEIGERGLAGRHRVARKANLAKVEVEVAFLGDVPRRGQRRGVTFEQRPHLRATFQAVLGVGKQVSARLVKRGPMADRYQHVVKLSALADVVVDLVGGDDRRAASPRYRTPAFE